MTIRALGYVGISTSQLDDWATYATKLLGLQVSRESKISLSLRADKWTQRLFIEADGGSSISVIGWEVEDAKSLEDLAKKLDSVNHPYARGTRALAEQRYVKDLIVLHDPGGNRLEIFWGALNTAEPFRSGRAISGFRTGPTGLGHVVMQSTKAFEVIPFYRDVLGFGVTDFYDEPVQAAFFHVNVGHSAVRHHSFAVAGGERDATHHLLLEMLSLDDVGQGLDLALLEEGRLAATLGRHTGCYTTSFYTKTPSGFLIETGWGHRLIDSRKWKAVERLTGPSLWGHKYYFMPPEARARTEKKTLENVANGERRPVQVIVGNYEVMSE